MTRDRLFCGLFILAAGHGLSVHVKLTVTELGWAAAALDLFGVSVVVWAACVVAAWLLYNGRPEAVTADDTATAGVVLALSIVPFITPSWVAVTALGLHLLRDRPRAALIALAITVAMLWAPLCGPVLLKPEAALVATAIGTSHAGNHFLGVSGQRYVIQEPCSSLPGMAIAALAFVTIAGASGTATTPRQLAFGAMAVLSALAVNVARLSLIGTFPAYLAVIHGAPGATIAAAISLALVVILSLVGVDRPTLEANT